MLYWQNKLKWNLQQNINIFLQENAFENVVCKMLAILLMYEFVAEVQCMWYNTTLHSHSTVVTKNIYMNILAEPEYISIS